MLFAIKMANSAGTSLTRARITILSAKRSRKMATDVTDMTMIGKNLLGTNDDDVVIEIVRLLRGMLIFFRIYF